MESKERLKIIFAIFLIPYSASFLCKYLHKTWNMNNSREHGNKAQNCFIA